ncbi:MAG TPA: tryptophan--tRNA ligase [Thermoplasmata archaeon]|nr:tryptophan--tRNA ligase [Thermoplasmata archaeon]
MPDDQRPAGQTDEFKVTPWEVTGRVDYERLVKEFGTQRLTSDVIARLSRGGEPHWMLRRDIFYSHRDLDILLAQAEKGRKWFLYTGRGPSGDIHVGHLLPWVFTKWLQEIWGAKLYFQITDDEKFLFKDDLTLREAHRLARENMLDIIACGFDPKLTKFIWDTRDIKKLYPLALEVEKRITYSTAKSTFGFNDSMNIGQIRYTALQSVPCFLPSELEGERMNCLIPAGIDQDPHFRLTRDIAEKLGYPKPSQIHNKLMPALTGPNEKMSASSPYSTISLNDDEATVKKKAMAAFTGGRATVEEQRRLGADPDVCSAFAFYKFMFVQEDKTLDKIEMECRGGKIMCGECKQTHLAPRLIDYVREHQERREKAKERFEEFLLPDD